MASLTGYTVITDKDSNMDEVTYLVHNGNKVANLNFDLKVSYDPNHESSLKLNMLVLMEALQSKGLFVDPDSLLAEAVVSSEDAVFYLLDTLKQLNVFAEHDKHLQNVVEGRDLYGDYRILYMYGAPHGVNFSAPSTSVENTFAGGSGLSFDMVKIAHRKAVERELAESDKIGKLVWLSYLSGDFSWDLSADDFASLCAVYML